MNECGDAILSQTRPLATSRRHMVYRAPEFDQRLPGSYEVDVGETIRLEVSLHGTPQPDVHWYKNNRDITDENRYHITNDGFLYQLRLERAGRDDEGTYKVKAFNKEGETASITYVEVLAKKIKKKFSHMRSVSVPASFPEITESSVEEAEEERVLSDLAPSSLSKRLRSSRGSLRKDHTWPRVVANKSIPSECIAYIEEPEAGVGEDVEGGVEDYDDEQDGEDVNERSWSCDASSEDDTVEKAEREEPETACKDKRGGVDVEIDVFEKEMKLVLESQLRSVTDEGHTTDCPASEADIITAAEEVEKAREIWRELARLNQMELLGIRSRSDSSSVSDEYDPQLGEFSWDNLNSLCDSVFLGADIESLAQFYALALPLMTFCGLWMELYPLNFILCILILSAMRHTGTLYKKFSRTSK